MNSNDSQYLGADADDRPDLHGFGHISVRLRWPVSAIGDHAPGCDGNDIGRACQHAHPDWNKRHE